MSSSLVSPTEMENEMKILVLDDNAIHREAAIAQLAEHDLTVVSTYDEAQELILSEHEFDVLLADLLMPPSLQAQGERHRWRDEMPVGIFIALLASIRGFKYVAVFSDSNHHQHPASACFDAFNEGEGWPTPFMVNGAKVVLSNTRNWINHFQPDNLANEMDRKEWCKEENLSVQAKNWAKLLKHLLEVPLKMPETEPDAIELTPAMMEARLKKYLVGREISFKPNNEGEVQHHKILDIQVHEASAYFILEDLTIGLHFMLMVFSEVVEKIEDGWTSGFLCFDVKLKGIEPAAVLQTLFDIAES
jgi:CheY-like chemotaxis protein